MSQMTAISILTVITSVAVSSLSHAAEPPTRAKQPPPRQADTASLQFASVLLKQRFNAFLEHVGKQNKSWQVNSLTVRERPYFEMLDGRKYRRNKVSYYGTWRHALKPHANWRPHTTAAIKPQRKYGLGLAPSKDDPKRIQNISFNGTYGPPHNGWAARLRYELAADGQGHHESAVILFSHNQQDSDELPAGPWHFQVPDITVTARYRVKQSHIELVARASLPYSRYQQKLLGGAMATPTALRDLELQLCDELEAELRKRIEKGYISFVDYSNVRSDNPPRELPGMPGGGAKLTDEEQAALLANGLRHINFRRQRWRDHADELHGAVQEAFPLLMDWTATRPDQAKE